MTDDFAEFLRGHLDDNVEPHVRRIVAAAPDAALSGGPGRGRTLPLPDGCLAPPPVVYLQKAGEPGRHLTLQRAVLGYEYRLSTDRAGQPVTLPDLTIHYRYTDTEEQP